ncbi:uncharacterized protein LOC143622475 [Bidens hawaiensis]|uniref:uncharacterized protein LOC143622475 n=1 Tax=Bidens hawaiensis TaxID=980011 RepID=UPI00404B35D8
MTLRNTLQFLQRVVSFVHIGHKSKFLVCQEFFNRWHGAGLKALNRELSDHNPILLTVFDTNYGPKPFKWFDSWLDRDDCFDVVKNALSNAYYEGPADISLFKKLAEVKRELKKWWKCVSTKEGEEISRLQKDISWLENKMEDGALDEEDLWIWEESKKELASLTMLKNKDLKQNSRVKWASFGDDNSAYFHRCVNGRKAANMIPGVLVNGEWISKPSLVKREVLRFL